MADDWTLAERPPETEDPCIAVVDVTFTCDWFFARYLSGIWLNLSTGQRIYPTHWTPLLKAPSECGAEAVDA